MEYNIWQGADLQKAYKVYQLFNGTADCSPSNIHYFPKGYTIATILWEGTTLLGSQVAPYNPTEIQHYFKNVLSQWEQNIVGTINVTGKGTKNTVAPGPSSTNDYYGVVFENTLDLEMAGDTCSWSKFSMCLWT